MSDNIRAILLMVLSMAFFVVGDSLIKLIGERLPVGEMVAIRGIFAVGGLALYVWLTRTEMHWRRALHPLFAIRNAAEAATSLLFFSGLMLMPFSLASVIGQSAPLVVTAAAALFLGQRVGWRRWTATVVGFTGVVLVLRPTSGGLGPGALLMLGSVATIALRDVVTRQMGMALPLVPATLLSVSSIWVAGIIFSLFQTWVRPTVGEVALLALCAGIVSIGIALTIASTRIGELAVVAPFRYSAVVFGLLSGIFVFKESIAVTTLVGLALIVGAGLYTVHRERVRGRDGRHAASAAAGKASADDASQG